MPDLQEYIKNAFQEKFENEIFDVRVNNKIPHQVFVKVRVQNVHPEMSAFARAMEQEFAELDRQVDIEVVG